MSTQTGPGWTSPVAVDGTAGNHTLRALKAAIDDGSIFAVDLTGVGSSSPGDIFG